MPGQAALSGFRLDKCRDALSARLPDLAGLDAAYSYFVKLAEPLEESERQRLEALLLSGDAAGLRPARSQTVYVAPRPGTISAWSSKATDIAQACGLGKVLRIERALRYALDLPERLTPETLRQVAAPLMDRMTESIYADAAEVATLFAPQRPEPLQRLPLLRHGAAAIVAANEALGLALSADEIEYLVEHYLRLGRDPSDAELMMFAQANSEHCRHKIFRADWLIDGEPQALGLFDMIRTTTEAAPDGVISAYADNAAVIEGPVSRRLMPRPADGRYSFSEEPAHILIKVETHNHPTAISPFPGAATGSGGEIRDEGATGLGARPKAGLCGFTVSHLRIPGWEQPWEPPVGHPDRMATPLEIMLEGPIGAAAFNNEFGRPNLLGYFRTFEGPAGEGTARRGYHKPIMIAGGVGNVRPAHALKKDVYPGGRIVLIGGPAMLIGLGGGAASSVASGSSSEDLDYASVQRGNPEIQRRAQEVIDRCTAMGEDSPILLIHDVGAGGLSNAVPEAVDHSHLGARVELRAVPNAEPGMSPMAIWCNEAQERYVLIVAADRIAEFEALCERERCPVAVIGTLTDDRNLVVSDAEFGNEPVDMPMTVLLGKPPRMLRDVGRRPRSIDAIDLDGIEVGEALRRVLRFPAVADKSFLIHIGDRTVGGLSARDQLVGPWQVPVSDVAITASGFDSVSGEAMAMGERTPLATVDAPASGRMAVAEALTNILAAGVDRPGDVRLSANWMAAAGHAGEDAALFDTVRAVSVGLCRDLGIAIPVGKDSLSMRAAWQEGDEPVEVVSPVSLIVSAFAPVRDVRRHLTPQLRRTEEESLLLLVDLGDGMDRLGGSCLAQVYGRPGGAVPDVDDPLRLRQFFEAMRVLRDSGTVLAYHDRSDGGLVTTVAEMMFAGRLGVTLEFSGTDDVLARLFSEEAGAVLQVLGSDLERAFAVLAEQGLRATRLGPVTDDDRLTIRQAGRLLLSASRTDLQRCWSETSYRLQALRDNPVTALQEYDRLLDAEDPGLNAKLTFDPAERVVPPRAGTAVPRVAILREQGVNSQYEMAAAFMRAGFDAYDLHMSDILEGRATLEGFQGIVACGGFSFGDVLGAGGGWAKSILYHARTRDQFADFFGRGDTFALGVCNGCQMLSHLRELVPGGEHWPRFLRNESEQFEARLSLVEIVESPSIFLTGMSGSRLPIATSHGEGRAVFAGDEARERAAIALRYVDNRGRPAETYPANPNGSAGGICGLTTRDGRVTIMMPHPERVAMTVQHSWHPEEWGDEGPWMRMFRNARLALD